MKLLRRLIDRYPYRGLFGWATACVWAFVIAETMWHLSAYVRNYDILEIPLVVPYAPLAAILDPHDAMIPHKNIFFFAFANWLVIFLIGAAVAVWRRVGTRLTGSATLLVVLAVALGRAYVFWLTHRHIAVPWEAERAERSDGPTGGMMVGVLAERSPVDCLEH